MYEIKGQKKSHASPNVILAAVCEALSQHRIHIESEDDSSIMLTPLSHFTQRILLGLTCNAFRNVSRGVVSVQREDGHSVLFYRVSLLRIRLLAMFFTILAIVGGVLSGDLSVFLFLVSFVMIVAWGCFYGINYLMATVQLSNFFDGILRIIPAEQPPISKQEM